MQSTRGTNSVATPQAWSMALCQVKSVNLEGHILPIHLYYTSEMTKSGHQMPGKGTRGTKTECNSKGTAG